MSSGQISVLFMVNGFFRTDICAVDGHWFLQDRYLCSSWSMVLSGQISVLFMVNYVFRTDICAVHGQWCLQVSHNFLKCFVLNC